MPGPGQVQGNVVPHSATSAASSVFSLRPLLCEARGDFFYPALLLVFTALVYLPFVAVPGSCPLSEDFDWVMASFEAVRKTIVEYGQFPWWNPWQFGGVPGFADPQMPVFSLEMLCVLVFGTFYGLRVALWLESLLGALGMYLMFGDVTRDRAARFWGAAIFANAGLLHLHWIMGHFIMSAIVFFPWLLWTLRRLPDDRRFALGFGLALGLLLDHSLQYLSLMTCTVLIFFAVPMAVRHRRERAFWLNALAAFLAAVAVSGWRVVVTLDYILHFRREMPDVMTVPLLNYLKALLWPFVSVETVACRGEPIYWRWHEISCYTGVIAAAFAFASFFRRWSWPQWGMLGAALLAYDTAMPWLPGYWLHRIPPYTSVFVMTRWRFFFVFFLAVAAAQTFSCVVSRRPRWRRALLALAAVSCLALAAEHVWSYWLDPAVEWTRYDWLDAGCELESASPIRSVVAGRNSLLVGVKRNLTALDGYQSLLGYTHPEVSGHPAYGEDNYAGECFTVEGGPVEFLSWTPNRIVFRCDAPAVFGVNQNPGNYWRDADTGQAFFPDYRDFEPDKTFLALCTPGVHTIVARPRLDAWGRGFSMAALCLLLSWYLVEKRRRKRRVVLYPRLLPAVKKDTNPS